MSPDHVEGRQRGGLAAAQAIVTMNRIVHLSSAHPADDVRIFLKQARSLARAGYDVSIVARNAKSETRDGVSIHPLSSPIRSRLGRFVMTAYETYRRARSMKADLYHFHDPELMPFAALLRLTGARVIYDVHEDVPKQILSKPWLPMAARRPVSTAIAVLQQLATRLFCSAVVVATPAIGERFAQSRTTLVQNFPLPGELAAPDGGRPMPERPKELLYVGAISRIRGAIENVAAMAHVESGDARLVLVGKFDRRDVEAEARAHAGWQRVECLGQQPRTMVAERMARARAGLVLFLPEPNHVDAQPNKMFEYMSAGLPVIASDFPLWRQIIDGAKCGLLVDPRDPQAIARAIDWVLANPDAAEAMGERGRRAVAEIYNWPAEERKLIALYRRLLG
jgi:glycosyltransferase involved in cell wall biosynthesis